MEIAEMIKEFIKPELLIVVPVLYLLGAGLKNAMGFKNKFIPMTLGIVGTILTACYLLATVEIKVSKDIALLIFTALTQGILLAGASVYINQLIKQSKKTK